MTATGDTGLTEADLEDALTAAGCNPRRGSCRCPSPDHNDSDPSATYSIGNNGRVLLFCHAGCTFDQMLAGIREHLPPLPRTRDDRPICRDEEYIYRTADSSPSYRVTRYYKDGAKQFAQGAWDTAKGTWRTGRGAMEGITPIPYRLPELLAGIAAGETVYVVEGEKDVESLRRAGLTATCNHGGAGKFRHNLATWFTGATVTIIADCDNQGISHATQVAETLRPVATVTLYRPPYDIGTHKDVSDLLAEYGSLDDLIPLDTPTADEPAPAGDSPLRSYEVVWPDLWNNDIDASEWMCEPVIPAGSKVTHIYAPRAEGKSALSLYLAAAMATGRAVLDKPVGHPIRVAYIDVEMSRTELRDYLEGYGYGPNDDLSHFHYLVDAPIPHLDTVEGGLEIVRWVESVGPDVLFVDSITSVLKGEENSNDAYQQLFNFTIAPLKRLGVPSVWTGNSGKDREKGSRGGSRKEDLMDCIWRMERGDEGLVKLVNTKRRASWIPEKVVLQRNETIAGLVTYEMPEGDINDIPVGSVETAKFLDQLGLPIDIGSRAAQVALTEAGHGRKRAVVLGALKYRRWAADKRGLTAGTTPGTTSGTAGTGLRVPPPDDDF